LTARPNPKGWAVAALALFAASCAGAQGENGPRADAPPPKPAVEAVPVERAPAAEPAPQRAALPPPPKPAPPPMPPEKLVGLDHQALRKLLGQPVFRRTDAPAELWRYRAGRCILDLFLYPPRDAPGGPLAVTHIEARLSDGTATPAVGCLDAVLKARAGADTT